MVFDPSGLVGTVAVEGVQRLLPKNLWLNQQRMFADSWVRIKLFGIQTLMSTMTKSL
jgi:hypothetical protein